MEKKSIKYYPLFVFWFIVIISVFIFHLIAFVLIFYITYSLIMLLILGSILGFLFYKNIEIINDFIEVENVSNEIAKGNYSRKIDVEKNSFKYLSKSLNATGDSLELAIGRELKSERMKTELITNVSHDLKTPLTSIINYSQLINQDNISEDNIKEYANIINEKSNKLKILIENLFELSKVSSKNVKLDMRDIDFKELVKQISGEWSDKFEEKIYNA